MDKMIWLQMLTGGFGSNTDLAAVLAFVAFSVVAFLSPVIGYGPKRSAGMVASLFLLAGYVGVSVIQLIVQWKNLLDGSLAGFGHPEGSEVHLLFAFALLKMVLFLTALLAFAIGVLSLRIERTNTNADPAAPDRRGN